MTIQRDLPWRAGTVLGRKYRIISEPVQGGMGDVYRAEDLELHRVVALKTVRLGGNARTEAETLASIVHPNVVTVHAFVQGSPDFMVLEYIDGETLAEYLARRRKGAEPAVERQTFLAIARQLAEGLDACHSHHVTHGDLKPWNIILADDRHALRVKICDFGIASRASDSGARGATWGTHPYMAPERQTTPRADIYSLGVVLFELATGAPPTQQSSASLRSLWSSRALVALIHSMMARDPEMRPATARSIIDALDAPTPEEVTDSMTRPSSDRPYFPIGRRRVVLSLIVLTSAVLSIFVVMIRMQSGKTTSADILDEHHSETRAAVRDTPHDVASPTPIGSLILGIVRSLLTVANEEANRAEHVAIQFLNRHNNPDNAMSVPSPIASPPEPEVTISDNLFVVSNGDVTLIGKIQN